MRNRANWQIPPGVQRGTWDYVQSQRIAQDYDRFVDATGLMSVDVPFALEHLPRASNPGPVVADLGCGTARVARQLIPLGYRVLNLDLSQAMLAQAAGSPAEQTGQQCNVRVNLAQLSCLRPDSLDAAVCLFSSLGMISGRANRRAMLSELYTCLRPSSPLILHVHNRYQSLFDPGGLRWLVSSRLQSLFRRQVEFGDRVYVYRGLPKMFLHIFSRRELYHDLKHARFDRIEIYPLNKTSDAVVDGLACAALRAGGFLVVARK